MSLEGKTILFNNTPYFDEIISPHREGLFIERENIISEFKEKFLNIK